MTEGNSPIQELRNTVAKLRGPDGCPWDREQTHQSLAECLVEECAELLDTIDRADLEHMREELGDVLLQVVMHAQLAEETGAFDLDSVVGQVNEKLIRRHPHVFGEFRVEKAEEALARWDEIKSQEKSRGTEAEMPFKELPLRLPALLFALDVYKQIQKKRLATDGSMDEGRLNRLGGGMTEARAGEMLFEIVAACRLARIDPESALRRYVKKVVNRIAHANRH